MQQNGIFLTLYNKGCIIRLIYHIRGGVFYEIIYQPEHIRVLTDVVKGIIEVRAFRVYKVKYP